MIPNSIVRSRGSGWLLRLGSGIAGPAGLVSLNLIAGLLSTVALAQPLPADWKVSTEHPLTLKHGDHAGVLVLVEPPSRSPSSPSNLIKGAEHGQAPWTLSECQTLPNHTDNSHLALRVCRVEAQDQVAMVIGLRRQDGQLQRLIGAAPARDAGQLSAMTLEIAAHAEDGRLDSLLAGEGRTEPAPPADHSADRSSDHTEVHGVYAQWISTGSAMYARPRVLFASGDVLKDMSLPPDEVRLDSPGSRNQSDWGRWNRRDNEYRIRWDDGSESTWPLDSATFFPVHPGPAGLRLDGRFRAMTTMSVAEPQGGRMTSASWRTLALSPDGHFVQGQGVAAAGANIAAHGLQPDQHGEYHIDGFSIELRFADGTLERTGFFIVAARDYAGQQPDVFGIGNTVFTRSRSSR